MTHISDIKLIRTDTTLDLSQKAEKGMLCPSSDFLFYTGFVYSSSLLHNVGLSIWNQQEWKHIFNVSLLCT